MALTNVVFWVAHVHATLIADWSHEGGRPGWSQARQRMKHEFPLFAACVPTLVVLVLAGLGFYGVSLAVWLSLIIGIVLLAGWGLAIARIAQLGVGGRRLRGGDQRRAGPGDRAAEGHRLPLGRRAPARPPGVLGREPSPRRGPSACGSPSSRRWFHTNTITAPTRSTSAT